MPDALYTRAAATSLRLLTKYGRDVTLRTYTPGSYNTSTGTVSPSTSDATRKGALFDYGKGQERVRETLITAEDKRCLLDANGSAPQLKDHIVVGTDNYVIMSVGVINPAGTVALYDLMIRKGG